MLQLGRMGRRRYVVERPFKVYREGGSRTMNKDEDVWATTPLGQKTVIVYLDNIEYMTRVAQTLPLMSAPLPVDSAGRMHHDKTLCDVCATRVTVPAVSPAGAIIHGKLWPKLEEYRGDGEREPWGTWLLPGREKRRASETKQIQPPRRPTRTGWWCAE